MYFSRLILNTASLKALRALADSYVMHQLLWNAFPDRKDGGPGKILYRVEYSEKSTSPSIIVQSEKRPDWNTPRLDGCFQKAEYKEISPGFYEGQKLRFLLKANPAKRVKVEKSGKLRSARVGLFGEEKQLEWLERKAVNSGFAISDVLITGKENLDSKASGRNIRHLSVTFKGFLKITDPQRFSEAFAAGIGPAKAFGFGMLSLAGA